MNELKGFTETLRITKKNISAHLMAVSGREFDSYVIFAPTFNLSGYGATKKEAEEMIMESFKDFVSHLLSLSPSKREAYLIESGFSKEKLKSKNFSKAYIDEKGELQNLSLEDKTYELTNLVA
jgi:hypothetical protein